MAHFEYSSVLNASRKSVFEFFTDMKNLGRIMPGDYKIEPTAPLGKMKKGMEYEVRLTRFGISVLWGIVIEEFNSEVLFRDRQTHGPFAFWVHTHKFEDHGQGTLLTDMIEYDVPFGLLGKLADDLYVRRELQRVFSQRHRKAADLLGAVNPEA